MSGKSLKQLASIGLVGLALAALPALAQKTSKSTAPDASEQPQQFVTVLEPDAQRTKNEFSHLLNRYPSTVRGVFRQDPALMNQPSYLAPYPALASFLAAHPDIVRNPAFYLDGLGNNDYQPRDHASQVVGVWDNILRSLIIFAAFGMAIGLLTWLIRTFLDYRRWNRLSRTQAEVHTRLLDRFSTNEELMAYIATPAGSKFLSSAPISLDTATGSRMVNAPLNRILWSVQAGVVLAAVGVGLLFESGRIGEDGQLPLEVMGTLALALGAGFVISAGISYMLSRRMGLLDSVPARRSPEAQ